MLQISRLCDCREPHLWPAACRLPSLQSDVLLLSCRAVETRTGQGQGHSRAWGAAVGAQPACRDSFCRRCILICSLCPVLCEPGQSPGDSAASPMAAWWFHVQKAAAGQWEILLLSTPWLLLLQLYVWKYCTAQQHPHPLPPLSSKTNHKMAERGEEQEGFIY